MAVLALGAAAAAGQDASTGVIGPSTPAGPITGNGRLLTPYGRLTAVGNVPMGGAATPDGRFYWTVSAGRGHNDVRIVDVATGALVQTILLPGASGGIVMDPAGKRAYVSGTPSSSVGEEKNDSTVGTGGDVIHVFVLDATTGHATEDAVPIAVPPPQGTSPPQDFPPTNTTPRSWPQRLAISPDGTTIVAALNLADRAAIVDVAKKKTAAYVSTGNYSYGAAVLPDGRTALVSNETPGTVSVIDLATGAKTKDITVGDHLSHPEAIAADPTARRAFVALANTDRVAVIDTTTMELQQTIDLTPAQGRGVSPVALTVTPDGRQLLVAEAGADRIAVVRLRTTAAAPLPTGKSPPPGGTAASGQNGGSSSGSSGTHRRPGARTHRRRKRLRHRRCTPTRARDGHVIRCRIRRRSAHKAAVAALPVVGLIPTAAYPSDVQVTRGGKLLWVAAKGLGVGPNCVAPSLCPVGDPRVTKLITPYGEDGTYRVGYLPDLVTGQVGVADLPSEGDLGGLTAAAQAQTLPSNSQAPPADTPLRPGGPIKHVFYLVRENRTYDQVLGDETAGDGDPKLTLFGAATTPNMHALVERFGIVDHFYANSEASIDGHFWTSAANVSDYVVKNWNQNYRGNGRPYDFGVYSVTWPGTGFLFDQTQAQGISWANYGEAIAGTVPLNDRDRTPQENAAVAAKAAKSDLGPPQGCYANDASIGTDAITQRRVYDSDPLKDTAASGGPALTDAYESRVQCFAARFSAQDATGTVPAFNYLVMTNDHTQGTSGVYSPSAMVAENDQGLGQLVDLISHSKTWASSAIFVVEDDSQNGSDHVDAHRIPVAVISPYSRGGVTHTRYDFPSAIRSMELILGMKPAGLFDATATPMYDAFSPTANTASYTDAPPPSFTFQRNSAAARAQARSEHLNFRQVDRVPQEELDRILWQSVHGAGSEPPPPGPNGEPGQ